MNNRMGSTLAIASMIFLLISSCSNVATSTNNIESTATVRISTNTPTTTPTLIPTKVVQTLTPLPPESILKFQRFEVSSELPSSIQPVGGLVIWDEPLQLLRFKPDVHLETLPDIDPEAGCLATSPDGKWLSYCLFSDQSPTGRWLFITSADGREQKKVPMDIHLISFGDYQWLDNQHLIFPLIQAEHQFAYPVVVINPFTGKQTKLSSNYSELHLGISGPASAMDFNLSDVVYDPSLDLVIFPAWGGEHNYIVLWDRRSQAVVAKVEDQSGGFGHYPLWSPDAAQFAVAVVNAMQGQHIIEEWYSVSREGLVEQMTRFGDYFSDSDIGQFSNWSPDGQKLAFWLNISPSSCPGLNLAVLEVSTKEVTNTCISGRSDFAPSPIWSLDSQFIVIKDYTSSEIKTILVDLENSQAFNITTLTIGSPPIGWLDSP